MSVQVDQISSFQKRLQFNVPGATVSRKLDDAYKTLAHRVNIPGFRRGHVPRRLLEQRYGKQILGEVASDIINTEFRQAAVDLEFIGQPEVERDDLKSGSDFNFSITIQVRPSVEIGAYTGLKIDFPVPQVSDDQVEAQVKRRLSGHARLVEVEENRPVQRGDLALTEVTFIENGEEKTVESGTMINTAGDRYYPGLEELIVGLAKDASRTGSVTIGEGSQLPGVKGKTVEARVKVLGIQVSRVPDLTDDVAAELGYEGGVDAMRAALRMDEENRANEAARNVARVNLLQKLTGAHSFDVPPAMIESHLQLLLEELRIQATYRGRDPRSVRYTEAQMADLRQRAEFAARASLILDAVARKESIVVSDADLEQKYQEIADMRGQRVEAIRGYFKKDNAVEELRKRLLEERTLEWLLERSELVDVAPDADKGGAPEAKAEEPKAEKKKPAKKAKAEEPAAEAAAAPAAEEKPAAEPKPKKKAKAEAAEAAPAEAEAPAAEEKPKKRPAKKKAEE